MLMRYRLSITLSVIFATGLLWRTPVLTTQPDRTAHEILLDKCREIEMKSAKDNRGIPICIESSEEGDVFRGEVYGVIEHPFKTVRDAITAPSNWCDMVSVHYNIKACTWRRSADQYFLTFYSGSKNYQAPEDAYQLNFDFRVIEHTSAYLKLLLTADEGPFDTKDYRIEFEAMPAEQGKTIAHFSYSYRTGFSARLAIKIYYQTIGYNKVGFTVIETDEQGSPVYVRGTRGMIERNAVRYYLAIRAYLDTLPYPDNERFEQRINRWYDLTNRYPRQLFELKKADYLQCKIRERQNQIALQHQLSQSLGENPMLTPSRTQLSENG
ncbi:MAG: hypothetical protein JSV40_08340 [Deltaproteobacteria bacterium]|nr:MAG: hypothetical protein JSV40_08340 [Deltaproteobacteria bacterium]